MRFGGEMHDRTRTMFRQQSVDQRAVADVSMHEDMARIAVDRCEIFAIARVGQGVEIDDRLITLSQPVQNEVAADETGAAGDEKTASGVAIDDQLR
jgi:hypothetical protein